ncbi:MAG TPA: histidine kinase [Pyrinomonadaceae bacterium]|jgi:signal transduction histidine kinase
MISMMRLILALSALLIIYIDPSEPDRFVAITYAALVLYSAYSAVLYFLSFRHDRQLPFGVAHWIDVGCYLVLIALSSGTNSIFFFFFFFAILSASFRSGFKAGLQVTIVSAVAFTLIGVATSPSEPDFQLNRFLLRPIYLLVLGYMMAYWGGSEIMLKRRLNLLKEVTTLANPRFGIEHTLASVMKRLQAFYDADLCLLIYFDAQAQKHRLMRLERSSAKSSARAEPIPETLAQLLLSLPEHMAVLYKGRRNLSFQGSDYYAFDTLNRKRTEDGRAASALLAVQLEASSFVSIPLELHGQSTGRLYLTTPRRVFTKLDVGFLMQVVEQIGPIVENIRLLERLASRAAEQERQRLARDIHDSVIQPYIGLQYKLAAIRNKIAAGQDVPGDIERLFQMTVNEIKGLRGFVRGLKDSDGKQDDFMSAVRRFAAQFADNYDLDVQVESKGAINVNGRLAAELIKIIHEGLSNVRKHTEATSSKITLECVKSSLQLSIENDDTSSDEKLRVPFTPGSITERAEELGGHVRVQRSPDGCTVIKVEIPL